MTDSIPAGYMQNSQGHLVPTEKVSEIDQERDFLVREIVTQAKEMQQLMQGFKTDAMQALQEFIVSVAEKYDAKLGGRKGNVTLTSYDGKYKLMLAVNDSLSFDERLQVAKELVDECITLWAEGSNDNIRALVQHAFQTDKQGKINTSRVLGLLRLEIDDNTWQLAMDALKDSIHVTSSKEYLRLYERNEQGEYHQISLDVAAL